MNPSLSFAEVAIIKTESNPSGSSIVETEKEVTLIDKSEEYAILEKEIYKLNCPTEKHTIGASTQLWGEIEKTCNLDGVRDGPSLLIYTNGKIAKRGQYKTGVMIGLWERFTEDGKLLDIGYWREGKPDGDWKFWYKNGFKKQFGSFILGKKEGYWEYWRDDESPRADGHYRDGSKVGFWTSLDQDKKTKLTNFNHRFGSLVKQHSVNFDIDYTNEYLTVEDEKGESTRFLSEMPIKLTIGWSQDFGNNWSGKASMIYKSSTYSSDKKIKTMQDSTTLIGLSFESIYEFREKFKFIGKLSMEQQTIVSEFYSESLNSYNLFIQNEMIPILSGGLEYNLYEKDKYSLYSNLALGYGAGGDFGDGLDVSSEIFLHVGLTGIYKKSLRNHFICKIYYSDISHKITYRRRDTPSSNSISSIGFGVSYVYNL